MEGILGFIVFVMSIVVLALFATIAVGAWVFKNFFEQDSAITEEIQENSNGQ